MRVRYRVLAACECSGAVRDAFAARGWDAWSCDLGPSWTPGQHYQGDVRDLLAAPWDLIVAFPPCTYLNAAGMHHTWNHARPLALTLAALDLVRTLLAAPCPRVALENPVGIIATSIRPADQIIQPYDFGHDASKQTCLWLRGLTLLHPTRRVPPSVVVWQGRRPRLRWGNQTLRGHNRLSESAGRAAARAVTYSGIAAAMAEQWGGLVEAS